MSVSVIQELEEVARETAVYLVAGPPGCGKTTYVSRQVEAAVNAGKSVLLASLTKTAAKELAGRDLPIEPQRIGTLHAHAYRALGGATIAESKAKEWNTWVAEHGHPSAWRLSSARKADVDDPMEEGVAATEEENNGAKTEGDVMLEAVSVWRARYVPRPYWMVKAEVKRFSEAWDEWKEATGYLDFTDLIERCLTEHVPPPVDFDVMFLDEAQDSSRLEMMLALQWGGTGERLVVCGDMRQNIYEWRGSEPEVFLALDGLCKEKRVLSQSYRVPGAVHGIAQAWARQLRQDIVADYFPRKDADGLIVPGFVEEGPALGHADRIVEEVQRVAESGQTVMLLATTRRLVDNYTDALKSAGILFHNPYRPSARQWNPLGETESGSGAAAQLVAFSRTSDSWGQDSRFWTPSEMTEWVKPIAASGLFVRGAKTRIQSGQPMSPDQFAELVEDKAALARMFSGDLAWYAEALTPAQKKGGRFKYPMAIAERHGVRKLTETPRVITGTVHSVKGGESDVVYVAPDLSRAGYGSWMDRGTRDQVVRCFYVACTRARERLVVCRPSTMLSVDIL